MDEKKLSRIARRKLSQAARRTSNKRATKKKLFAKRMKSPAKLKKSAEKAAKNLIVKKMTGGKSYSNLSVGQKELIDKKLSNKKGVVAKIARKMLPIVKKKEKERVKKIRAKNIESESFSNQETISHGVLTLNINGSHLEVSARKKGDKLIPYTFQKINDAKKHCKKVGGKPFQSPKTNLFYVEFTKLDGPINEDDLPDIKIKNPETGRSVKVSSALSYDKGDPVRKKALTIMSKLKDKVKEKIPKKQAIKNGIKDFFQKASVEKDETVQSMKILSKYAAGKKVTDDEKKYVADQFKDILKMTGMGAVAAAPGGSVAVPLLVKAAKKMNVDLMPSAFKNENIMKENEEDLKDLKAILDVAKMLSDKSPYFKGRGSKKEYIKMLVHKIKKLSEAKQKKIISTLDAYNKVRKPTMPKSRPMKNKKVYNRKDFKKGRYD